MTALLRFDGAQKRDRVIDTWLAEQPPELRALATPWLARVRDCGPDVRELMHDGLATLCVGDVPFAYVGIFTAHVNVGFFHGSGLPDPARMLQGTGRHMRHVKLRPGVPFDATSLDALIAASYRDIVARLEALERHAGK